MRYPTLAIAALMGCAVSEQAVAHNHKLRHVASGQWRLTWAPHQEGEDTTAGAVATYVRTGEKVPVPSNWIVSVVGPVVSYVWHVEDTSGTWLSAAALQTARAAGTPRGGWPKPAEVTMLFDAPDVLRAVLDARRVSRLLGTRAPAGLTELVEAFDTVESRDCGDLLSSFAVLRVEGRSAVVAFGIGGNHGSYDEFNVRIPIPSRSRAWFERASRERTLGLARTWGPATEP